MFDIGFMELMLIAIVSLVVIGPERLPSAIRTATLWIGRAKRSFNQVKTEIEREINTDEIRRQLHNESILAGIDKAKKQADTLVKDARRNVDELNTEVKATLEKEDLALKELTADKKAVPAPAPVVARELPAAPVEDPAMYDQEPLEVEAQAAQTQLPEAEAPKLQKPVEDFYNNPPGGTIQLKGGIYRATTSLDDETDSGRRI